MTRVPQSTGSSKGVMLAAPSIVIILFITILMALPVLAIPNPAAVYCESLGHEFSTIKYDDTSETGICTVDGEECDAWDFYKGTCAADKSACAVYGYDTITASKGEDPYSPEYAVCVDDNNEITGLAGRAINTNNPLGKTMRKLAAYLITGHATTDTDDNTSLPITEDPEPVRFTASALANINTTLYDRAAKFEAPENAVKVTGEPEGTANAPSSYDWRSNGGNWVTPVKNQASCGSCWAFGAIGTTEAGIKIGRGDPNFNPDLSEQQLVSCSGGGDCGGGYHTDALSYIESHGVADEACRPYTASNSACGSCGGETERTWDIDDYDYDYYPDNSAVKNHIVNHGPVAANYCNDGYFSGDIYRCDEGIFFYFSCSGHVITLVGYNDAGGYWIAKNSWGSSWNGDGYFKIGYDECGIGDSIISFVAWADYDWPEWSKTINVSEANVYQGHVSGALSNMNKKDGSYTTLYDTCSGSTCQGTNIRFDFNESEIQNPKKMTLMAYQRVRDALDFSIYYYTGAGAMRSLGLAPYYPNNWRLQKYELCDSESECESMMPYDAVSIKYTHPSCTGCSIDYTDIDWLVIEAELDTDDDGILDRNDACPEEAGSWCRGCPKPDCGLCSYNPYCPSSGQPYCASNNLTYDMCDSTERCSGATGNNWYGTGGEYLCEGYCDGSGNCDRAYSCRYSASCDPDDDDDGKLDGNDACPGTPASTTVDINGCSRAQVDNDMDGTCDPGKSSPTWCTGTDACNTTYGTECNGCPAPETDGCLYNMYCPPSGTPYYVSYRPPSYMCNAAYRCANTTGNDMYNTPGEYKSQGYCDGWGHCDYAYNIVYDPACDPDDDNDGISDVNDTCASTIGFPVDANGCNQTQVDSDKDRICNIGKSSPHWCINEDLCPDTSPPAAAVDDNGCVADDVDADSDGVCDPEKTSSRWCEGEDSCRGTPPELADSVDDVGCSQEEVDEDLDGVCDPGQTSGWCTGEDSCNSEQGPGCNDGCADSLPPFINMTLPENTTYNTRNVPITINISDNCLNYTWIYDGYENVSIASDFDGTLDFDRGNTTIIIYGMDSSDNINWTSAEFEVDYITDITVGAPDNSTYLSTSVPVNFSANESVANASVSFDGQAPHLLCSDCNSAEVYFNLTEGWHNATVMIVDYPDDLNTYDFRFFVDARAPAIHNYNFIHNQSINGSADTAFIVNYSETYMESVIFQLNLSREAVSGCTSGDFKTCNVTKDLSGLPHGTDLYFYFEVNDTSGRKTLLFAPQLAGPYRVVIDRFAPSLTINSPINQSFIGYFMDVNVSVDENSSISYALDQRTPIQLCSSCDSASRRFVALEIGEHRLEVIARDQAGHENRSILFFRVGPDFDHDGIPDPDDPDDDNDGIPDIRDRLWGNKSNIISNLFNFTILLNNTPNTSIETNDTLNVTFMGDNLPIIRFPFDFSRMLNLSLITVQKQTGFDKGKLLIRGLDLLNQTKTAYVDDIDPGTNTLCIKDSEVDSYDVITTDCSASDETSITCPSTVGNYTCTIVGSKYEISGLSHSAIAEIDVPSSPPQTGGSGGGGGGGSSSYTQTITVTPTLGGVTATLNKLTDVDVYINNEMYSFRLTSIGIADVMFDLSGYYYSLNLFDKEIRLDVNHDGIRDMKVRLESIRLGKATMTFMLYQDSRDVIELLPPAYSRSKKQEVTIPEETAGPIPIQRPPIARTAAQPVDTVETAPVVEKPSSGLFSMAVYLIIGGLAIAVFVIMILFVFMRQRPPQQTQRSDEERVLVRRMSSDHPTMKKGILKSVEQGAKTEIHKIDNDIESIKEKIKEHL